ncbi:hypothetical protein O0I26_05765 [Staphylococcus pseudintermedius]|uniref:hypothetical protein n=1 Tax=Staphylococcus pseudintermedius TaxID=283734 RepID=UPI0015D540DD|nr:hypothetical protein [Staphylococcus pseudintermedius]EHP0515339.1 hypothetical protein [Staphylococcus pseudintermedius]EHS7139795.1 hypothetical protein [Staphylococcus pseudintermedius]EHT3667749.1 hypothetical protein [Staphylococcus pseudintermedius]EHT8057910.1 hypothetical protein [Staphylococcus pseudintermedius]EHV5261146.1 hypothetical protein [Staphylococcus pseudintermedius]
MAKYEVLHDFVDSQDNDKLYKKGQFYPRPPNKKVDEERIMELSTLDNRRKLKVIKPVD